MGMFDLFFNRRRYASRGMADEYRAALRQIRQQRSKYYRAVRIAVIFAAALAFVFFVIAIAVPSLRHPASFKLCFVVLALALGGAACLPWITQIERDRRRKAKGEDVPNVRFYVAYAFFAFIGLCTVLWVISVFVIGDGILMNLIEDKAEEISSGSFTFLRIAIIISVQAAVGSVIATGLLRHGKKYLVLHVVMYAALLYLDFWVSWVAGGITVLGIEEGTFPPISNVILWVLAVMTCAAFLIAALILARQTRRKEIELIMKGDVKTLTEGDVDLIDAQVATASMYRPQEPASAPQGQSAANRLRELKELLDDGIITQEEYEEKRKRILSEM